MWDSFFRCSTLGVDDCVVWWEAWAVVVGAIVGLATTRIAFRAWQASDRTATIAQASVDIAEKSAEIAKDSARIAEDSARIAKKQLEEFVADRVGQASILGSLLQYEIEHFPARIGNIVRVLDRAKFTEPGIIFARQDIDWLLVEFVGSFLPATEDAQDRLHNLGKRGNDIAALVGAWKALGVPVRRMDQRIARIDGESTVLIGKGHEEFQNIMELREPLILLLEDGIAVATDFAKFVGKPVADYSEEEVLLRRNT
ncbi:hypothetical protein ABE493_01420 [Stenotrophomonas terrae]|uniref:hypothetical protein n=1 Tax=Stenotrophomonas terrae TaxID=405446 RepID=UPI00320A8562